MTDDFVLSREIWSDNSNRSGDRDLDGIFVKDVKEFIRRLKEFFGYKIFKNEPHMYTTDMIYKEIDTLAGEDLI